MRTRKGSLVSDATGAEATGSPEDEGGPSNGTPAKEYRGEGSVGVWGGCGLPRAPQSPLDRPPAGGRGHQVHKSWPTTMSDSDGSLDPSPGSGEGPGYLGAGGGELWLAWAWGGGLIVQAGPEASSGEAPAGPCPVGLGCLTPASCSGDFKKLERMPSSGTMSSSEELVDQEGSTGPSAFEPGEGPRVGAVGWGLGLRGWPGPTSLAEADHLPRPPADLNGVGPELPVAMPSGPFRNVGLSKAARTHRLRKLRTPAKCRECNSYVYFQGAECEEVRRLGRLPGRLAETQRALAGRGGE